MKKDYDKRVIHNFKLYNTQEVEEYLNQMAEKGFYLLEMTQHQMFFKKDTPHNARYSISYIVKEEAQRSYQKYCKTAGWDFVCELNKFQIYMTMDEEIPYVESDETKFKVLQKVRHKRILSDSFKLISLLIVAVLVFYYNGLAVICLSVVGLNLTVIGFLYGILLIDEVIDTLVWKSQCKKKVRRKEKLYFKFFTITSILNKIINILIFLCVGFIIVDSFYQFFVYLHAHGVKKGMYVYVLSLTYLFACIIGAKIRGDFSKRGGCERIIVLVSAYIFGLVVTSVAIRGFGKEVVTYSPEMFQLLNDEETSSKHIKNTDSILGRSEYYSFLGYGGEGQNADYIYRLYQSRFPFVIRQVSKEVFRTEGIWNYLKIYKQTDNCTVYIGSNHKVYPENADFQVYDTDLERYDGCIAILEENQLIIFYYKDFENMNIDQMIKVLEIQ